MNGIAVLAQRELIRFFRQPTRLLGSLAQPLLFWLFMGAGFSESFNFGESGVRYAEFFFPGVVLMLLLFAAIFSTITLIEDRNAGFLQGVLVAPVSRFSLVLGKLLGGTAIAMVQAVIFLFFAPLAGIELGLGIVLQLLFLFVLVGLGFTGFGFIVAWSMDTVSGYHAIMSVVMIPLWLLSGAVFPVASASIWLQWLMRLNPVTYAQELIRAAFYRGLISAMGDPHILLAFCVSCIWTGLTILIATRVVKRRGNR